MATQCRLAAAGIASVGATWPASGPTGATMTGHQSAITGMLTGAATLEGQLRTLRQDLADRVELARMDLAKVDAATDMLYGRDGAEKANFGIDPRKPAAASGMPEQVVIRATTDGAHPASIFVDWDAVEGCVYEVQWFSDAELTKMVGTQTVTSSELEIGGLTRGSQYWFRIRALRAGQSGPWSDQATRVANI